VPEGALVRRVLDPLDAIATAAVREMHEIARLAVLRVLYPTAAA